MCDSIGCKFVLTCSLVVHYVYIYSVCSSCWFTYSRCAVGLCCVVVYLTWHACTVLVSLLMHMHTHTCTHTHLSHVHTLVTCTHTCHMYTHLSHVHTLVTCTHTLVTCTHAHTHSSHVRTLVICTHNHYSHNYSSPLRRALHDAPGFGPSSECIHTTAACSGTTQGYPWLVKSVALHMAHLYIGM